MTNSEICTKERPPRDRENLGFRKLDPLDRDTGYLESKTFKLYAAAIKKVVLESEQPLSIRDIHRLLGERSKREWTADAIESLLMVEPVGILPTRYKERGRFINYNEVQNPMRSIFPQHIRAGRND